MPPPSHNQPALPDSSLARQLLDVGFGDWFKIFLKAVPAFLCVYFVMAAAIVVVVVVLGVVFGLGIAALLSAIIAPIPAT